MLLKLIEGAPYQLEGSQRGVSVGGSIERDLKEEEEAGCGQKCHRSLFLLSFRFS